MRDDVEMYLAIDPGGTTGLAWLTVGEDGKMFFGSEQIEGRYEAETWIAQTIGLILVDVTVIIERWDVRKNTHSLTNQDDPRYIIGYVDGISNALHHVTYVEQTPAQAKKFGTDAKLKQLGWYVAGEDHSRDAARHLLTYLVRQASPVGDHIRKELTT